MKNIVFVSATRADYGKLKKIILTLQKKNNIKTNVFITGMHNLKVYGNTVNEIKKDKIKNIKIFSNQNVGDDHNTIFSKTVLGFSNYIKKIKPDLVLVHGDRIEPLACAITCCLSNIKIAHFEGGEVSGTVDEMFRHSISKLCNIHFVTSSSAKKRLIQMGELGKNIFVTGSPDVDLILSKKLPSIKKVKRKYEINFDQFSIAIFHPVTTDLKNLNTQIKNFIKSLEISDKNYILIYPNNDLGSEIILKEYKKIQNKKIKIFPSIRFEYFLTILKNSEFIIGNSSSGIMEAPYFGVPTINIGTRQNKRAKLKSIFNCDNNFEEILKSINKLPKKKFKKNLSFGHGKSAEKILKIFEKNKIWELNNQKLFNDIKI